MPESAVQLLEMRVLGWALLDEGYERYKRLHRDELYSYEELTDCYFAATDDDSVISLPPGDPSQNEKTVHLIPKSDSMFLERIAKFRRSRVWMEMFWKTTFQENAAEKVVRMIDTGLSEFIELVEVHLTIISPKFDRVIIRFPTDEDKKLNYKLQSYHVEGDARSWPTLDYVVQSSGSMEDMQEKAKALSETPDDTVVPRYLTTNEIVEFRKLAHIYAPEARRRQKARG